MILVPRAKAACSVAILIACVFMTACGPNASVLQSGKETPGPTAAPRDSIEDELIGMHTAGFTYVFVLKRRDGGVMDADDRAVIRANTGNTNRRVSADNDRAFVVGSNPPVLPENMNALTARFVVEDHSPPAPAATENTNK